MGTPRDEVDPSSGPPSDARVEPTLPMAPPTSGVPQQVGRYVVLEPIGEGGMGVVLRALDPELDREVAVKLLHARPKPDPTEGTTRLLREAQALAKLSHPNVIDVYDVGVTEGRVFIAMEYVRGENLHQWLGQQPPLPELIDAFVQAGRGLVAAHAAGIVHRDFKPANVLRGEDGRVRVADFGLAAPIRGDDEEPTLESAHDGHVLDLRMTATGFAVGTPGYMSPEAHRGTVVDPQSDQWSFCASLYEALYGERPFDGANARELAATVHRGLVHPPDDPRVPARVRALVLRGLSVRPEDRWPSMAALLEQLRPPRARARRWLVPIVAAAATGATAVALWLALAPAPSAPCAHAAKAVNEVWNEAARGRIHAAFSGSGVSYAEHALGGVGDGLDAHALVLADARQRACETSPKSDASAQQHDRRIACLGRRLSELRGLVEVLEHADADTVRNAVQAVGDLRAPSECESDAVATVPPPPPSIAADVERAHDDIARARATRRAGHYDRARSLAELVLTNATALGHAPLVAEARHLHGAVLMDNGDYQGAERELGEAWHQAQAVGDESLAARTSTELVFLVGVHLRRPDDAERWARHARAAIERLADPTNAQTSLQSTLGNLRQASGDYEAARGHFERALAANVERLGPRHPQSLTVRSNLALSHHHLGDNERARALMLELLADRRAVFGPTHPEVSSTLGNLGVVEQTLGELEAAAEHTQQALDGLQLSVGQQHPLYPKLLTNLANTTYLMGSFDEALRMHQRAKELLERSLGPRDFIVGRSLMNIGTLLHRLERHDEARRALQQAREIFEEHLRPEHPELAILLGNLAEVDRDSGRLDEAMAGFDRSLQILAGAMGPEHPELAYSLAGRGQAHLLAGRTESGIADLRRAVELLEGAALDPESLARMRQLLAGALWDAGEHDHGVRMMEQARGEVERLGDGGAPLLVEIEGWLAEHRDEP